MLNNKNININNMERRFGIVKIRKGSILYNMSDERFDYIYCNSKPFLFCVFHPSEGDILCKYVHYIKLNQDLLLLYLIEGFDRERILSLIKYETDEENILELKKKKDKMIDYKNKLSEKKLDGFITSFDKSGIIEIGINNKYGIYKKIKTGKLKKDWINGYEKDGEIIRKNWGVEYKISTIKDEVELILNKVLKRQIKKYIKKEKSEYILQIILTECKKIYFIN